MISGLFYLPIYDNLKSNFFVGGVTANGHSISMNSHDEYGDLGNYSDLVTHEIGHLLGLSDKGGKYYSSGGIMKYSGLELSWVSEKM